MSDAQEANRGESSRAKREPRGNVVGTTLVLILAPIIAVAFAIALLAFIDALTGWSPEFLRRLMPVDTVSAGPGFTKPRSMMIVVGFGVGYLAAVAIRWGVHRPAHRADDPEASAAGDPVAPVVDMHSHKSRRTA
jgi:hypothetical protein